ncbi:MAG: addiction module protein [Ignavibacteriales bacterium]|nr:addiction module protein [Ignavibacteriales bacterium]
MSPQFESIQKEALGLPQRERELLAEKLILSLSKFSQEEIDKAWQEEIERRTKLYEAGKIESMEVHEVIKNLRTRL